MEWRDEGTLLSRSPHGETSAIVDVFTKSHGRHAGIVRGGTSRKTAAILQPGTQVDVNWRARLEDHLGTFTVEPLRSRAHLMSDRRTLACLNAITGLLSFALPEREPQQVLYDHTQTVLEMMDGDFWPLAYLQWELALLDELGFGLDLTQCAVTGSIENLAYISPKSGRAVAIDAAGKWEKRLFPLSPALLGKSADEEDIQSGLRVLGHFLKTRLAPALGNKPLPEARSRLVDLLLRK